MPSNLARQLDDDPETDRYQVLLELADLMVRHRTLPELFHDLAQILQKVISFDFIAFFLHDSNANTMRLSCRRAGTQRRFPPRCRWTIRPVGGSG